MNDCITVHNLYQFLSVPEFYDFTLYAISMPITKISRLPSLSLNNSQKNSESLITCYSAISYKL